MEMGPFHELDMIGFRFEISFIDFWKDPSFNREVHKET